MSDSFADLWNSTTPSKPAQARTLGSITPATQPQRRPTYDAFSVLAASSSSTTRSNTPSYIAPSPLTKSGSTGGMATVGGAKAIQKASGGRDTFSDLLSGSIASSSNDANLTMAQKAALANKQGLGQPMTIPQSASGNKATDSAWAGLDALGVSNFSASRSASSSPKPPPAQDDWIFDSVQVAVSKAPSSKPQTTQNDDDWGLNDFVSKPVPTRPSQTSSQSLWDNDEFNSTSPASKLQASLVPQNGRSSTPGSFDFGDREDGLLDDQSGDEDDILGALGKPVQRKPVDSPAPRAKATPSPRPPSAGSRSRAVSPPPHILGQIVEMGFSIQQACVALAATDTGLDVQAALETLLSNGAAAGSRPTSSQSRRPHEQETGLSRDVDVSDPEDVHPPPPHIHPRRDRTREPPARSQFSPGDGQKNIEDKANELIAQASTFGLSMFNRANALWKESKEKVQKAYEERAAANAASSSSSGSRQRVDRSDGRPKWMQETSEHDDDWHGELSPKSAFRDDHDDHDDRDDREVLPPHPDEQPRKQRPAESRPAAQSTPREVIPSSRARTGDLLGGDDAPKVYVSPFRRKTPGRSQVPTPVESKLTPAPAAPSPAPLVQRKCVSASASELSISAKHKATGTEMFKLGRYAEAETAYSYAIAALPDSHLLLIPLYNNRALTRIKTGDHGGAVEDCTTVLKIIGVGYHPAREAKVTKEEEGAAVDLADAYVKALRRRAEAYEGREKWEAAKGDWETLTTTEFAGKARSEAVQAASRCRRMLSINKDGESASSAPAAPVQPKPKPKPKHKSASARPAPPSEALNRVREANKAAEAEDQEKHALKDAVDARLLTWKGGKEANLRALIASLDTVLWPELGLQKVGMHELVTPSQVKIRYTKAIAKLHPDKLNVNNTTLEQRMIANGVFGALNEAWNSFKP
ncbi:hypothetical protein BDY19DRAFT_889810 [Irpex rosettiformis]|uniref:Uncharacterized protein n=1 Tax=Irpex rosettiformis TaxID=378272 RepID=A0ACB8U4L1_9APHY|nr:hypothetical protein BDY19DRAFT_889810 [Irpex rosettiformis]